MLFPIEFKLFCDRETFMQTNFWADSVLILKRVGNGSYAIVDGRHHVRAIAELTEEGKWPKDFNFAAWILKVLHILCFDYSFCI